MGYRANSFLALTVAGFAAASPVAAQTTNNPSCTVTTYHLTAQNSLKENTLRGWSLAAAAIDARAPRAANPHVYDRRYAASGNPEQNFSQGFNQAVALMQRHQVFEAMRAGETKFDSPQRKALQDSLDYGDRAIARIACDGGSAAMGLILLGPNGKIAIDRDGKEPILGEVGVIPKKPLPSPVQ